MPTLSNSIWTSADGLIEKMKQSGDREYDLVREHLETAHAYFLGAMTAECAHNLELARAASQALPGKPLEPELKETIATLLVELHPALAELHPRGAPVLWRHVPKSGPASYGRSSAGNGLADFFQRAGVSFGIFYPKEHVVAVLPTLEAARAGYDALSAAGFRIWEVTAVSGEEVEKFLEELRAHRSLWDDLMAEISRLLDTEVNLIARYAHWARAGAGFLVAYSPTEADAEGVSDLLKPLGPVAMHWFMGGYIRHLL
jgi:hypothetical protein